MSATSDQFYINVTLLNSFIKRKKRIKNSTLPRKRK